MTHQDAGRWPKAARSFSAKGLMSVVARADLRLASFFHFDESILIAVPVMNANGSSAILPAGLHNRVLHFLRQSLSGIEFLARLLPYDQIEIGPGKLDTFHS